MFKECIKAGASPRNAGGGIFASAPDRGLAPGIPGADPPPEFRG